MKTIEWFETNCTSLINNMRDCDHAYISEEEYIPSRHHREGSVLRHMNMCIEQLSEKDRTADKVLAVLLHDIGKPFTREQDDSCKKTRFNSHESVSAAMAYEILLKYQEDTGDIVSPEIITAVQWHTMLLGLQFTDDRLTEKSERQLRTMFNGNLKLWDITLSLLKADRLGRISDSREKDLHEISILENLEISDELDIVFSTHDIAVFIGDDINEMTDYASIMSRPIIFFLEENAHEVMNTIKELHEHKISFTVIGSMISQSRMRKIRRITKGAYITANLMLKKGMTLSSMKKFWVPSGECVNKLEMIMT